MRTLVSPSKLLPCPSPLLPYLPPDQPFTCISFQAPPLLFPLAPLSPPGSTVHLYLLPSSSLALPPCSPISPWINRSLVSPSKLLPCPSPLLPYLPLDQPFTCIAFQAPPLIPPCSPISPWINRSLAAKMHTLVSASIIELKLPILLLSYLLIAPFTTIFHPLSNASPPPTSILTFPISSQI